MVSSTKPLAASIIFEFLWLIVDLWKLIKLLSKLIKSRTHSFHMLIEVRFDAESLATIWDGTEMHKKEVGIVSSLVRIPIAVSLKTSITKATSKGHPHWRALSGARRIVWFESERSGFAGNRGSITFKQSKVLPCRCLTPVVSSRRTYRGLNSIWRRHLQLLSLFWRSNWLTQ